MFHILVLFFRGYQTLNVGHFDFERYQRLVHNFRYLCTL